MDAQPRGALMRCVRETGLSQATVHAARKRLVTQPVAHVLAAFAGGAFKASDMAKPRKTKRKAVRS